MKKIFKEAHKMTREMVEKFGVDYQAQFSLCLAYLLEKEEEKEVKELKGTEKQIKWANDLLSKLNKYIERVKEGYEKGEATEEEKERFENFINEKLNHVLENEKSWEIINSLRDEVKELWFLEDEDYMTDLKERVDNDEVEFEYNLADDIQYKLEEIFG